MCNSSFEGSENHYKFMLPRPKNEWLPNKIKFIFELSANLR
ncbi:hypothetical protein HMPREF9103_01683 [Lentilactobacillus parafarraginis F0439]|uniref:Uncharacterized protein n=1 Tax=Lentilactobacillus parafarraginis F0439 TaxID=797515 RepID=G9ZPM8_9LACO|nr:hypothetical protein HMPREF9103_01683 [Lentilactobacillus parafarraginis F0439]